MKMVIIDLFCGYNPDNLLLMANFANHCFVCGKEVDPQTTSKNTQFNLPVCSECKDTDKEKQAIEQLLDGMAEGFVCGCI